MKQTRQIMGMPITLEILDSMVLATDLETIFAYFVQVDERFSTYKPTSEISRLNAGEQFSYSKEMQEVLALSEQTKKETDGYFDIRRGDKLDPSGLVKGWAIQNAATLCAKMGFRNYYVEAGGDIQVAGKNAEGSDWIVGIRNPFNQNEIIKRLQLANCGIATSGTAARGQHIYNPHAPSQTLEEIVSLTVIAENVFEADRFATAAFAMGELGIHFLEKRASLEAYQVDKNGIATFTSHFTQFVCP